MKNNKNNNSNKMNSISTNPVQGEPDTSFELINKYGTYNIQDTADTENMYPAIAHGFNKKIIKTDCENKKD